MKKSILVLLFVFLGLIVHNGEVYALEENDSTKGKELKIVGIEGDEIKYILKDSTIPAESVSIIGSHINNLVENYEEINLKGIGSGEFFKAEVIGSIYDFQLVTTEFNKEKGVFIEKEILHEIKEIRNKTVYIETYLPCGIPSEKIKWKNHNGKPYEVLLVNDGYGFDGTMIFSGREIVENYNMKVELPCMKSQNIESLQKELLELSKQIKNHDDEFEIDRSIENYFNSNKHRIASVYYVSEIGRNSIYPKLKLPQEFDLRNREWYLKSKKNGKYISKPYKDAFNGKILQTLTCSINKNGKVIGVIGIDVYV
jgi:hypothetical protein